MGVCSRKTWLVLVAVAIAAAAPAPQSDDLVRQGNAAFDRGDFAAAVEFYLRAEERAVDPGLVAFNEAAALYQLGRYRDAELHLRRCREDAAGSRRARLLYNLGNCIVQQARGRNARRLREAIQCYEECLRMAENEVELTADAQHNLELARLLLQKADSAKESKDESNEETGAANPQPDEQRSDVKPGGDQAATTRDASGKAGSAANQAAERNAGAAKTGQPPPPGKGNLPPIPDDEELTPMSPEDAAEHLKEAAARISQERREYRQRATPAPPANVLDW